MPKKTISNPESLAKAKSRVKRHDKGLADWLTQAAARDFVDVCNQQVFFRLVEAAGVRTRQMPGESFPKYSREDLEKVAQNAIRVGLPERSASA